jgi:hypothetical protein
VKLGGRVLDPNHDDDHDDELPSDPDESHHFDDHNDLDKDPDLSSSFSVDPSSPAYHDHMVGIQALTLNTSGAERDSGVAFDEDGIDAKSGLGIQHIAV